MKMDKLKKRLRKNRPMSTISMRMPEDVVDDLKRVAPHLGFSGYQPLIRAYVGQGLRVDLEKLEAESDLARFIASLRAQGVDGSTLQRAIEAARIEVPIDRETPSAST